MTAHCPSLFDTSSWVALRWERRAGYYRAHLEQDLWGHWIVTRVVGRRGARHGRYMTTWVPSLEHGLMTLRAIARHRRERGYRLVDLAPARARATDADRESQCVDSVWQREEPTLLRAQV